MLKNIFQKVGGVLTGRRLDDELLDEWEEQLILADVSLETAEKLIEAVRQEARRGSLPTEEAAQQALQTRIIELLSAQDPRLNYAQSGITVWLFAGVNGVGKTTSVGKLACRLKKEGRRPLLAAADTFRAAAMEQLQEWGKRADCPVVAQQSGADPAAVVYDALAAARSRDCDVVLVDTAGRLHNKSNLMNELAKIARIIERETGAPPQETLLVLDASTGQNGVAQARAFTGSAPLTGLILTKWDGTAKGGIVLTVVREIGVPVKLMGIGELMEDIFDFNADDFVKELFR